MKEQRLPGEVINISIPDTFVEHGSVDQLHRKLGLDAENILARIEEWQEEGRG